MGPLAGVRDDDLIRLDVTTRWLDVLIDAQKLATRLESWNPPAHKHVRGYPRLYIEYVLQADAGCDFDFLRPESADALELVEPQVGCS